MLRCVGCGEELRPEDLEHEDEPRVCEKCWECPKCGARNDGPNDEHELTLEDDIVVCSNCESDWGYRQFEKAVQKKKNVQPCPTCKGKGVVPKKPKR